MANTKGYVVRQKVIDRCLQSERGYSIQEILDKCNYELALRGLHIVTSKNTIRDDIMEIGNTYGVYVETIRIGRNLRYRYEQRGFSIYKAPLTEKDIDNLNEISSFLCLFQGRDQFEWIKETNLRIQSLMAYHSQRKSCIVGFDDNPFLKGREHLTPLFEAIRNKHSLEIEYKKFNSQCVRNYVIYPYYIKQYNNRWFLFAQIDGYKMLSNFALDRILSIRKVEVPYIENNKYDLIDYFKDIIGVSRPINGIVENICVNIKKELLPYIETKPIHSTQIILEETKNNAIIQISVIPNFELEQVLLSYGEGLKVVSPLYLKEKIKKRIQDSFKNYD